MWSTWGLISVSYSHSETDAEGGVRFSIASHTLGVVCNSHPMLHQILSGMLMRKNFELNQGHPQSGWPRQARQS